MMGAAQAIHIQPYSPEAGDAFQSYPNTFQTHFFCSPGLVAAARHNQRPRRGCAGSVPPSTCITAQPSTPVCFPTSFFWGRQYVTPTLCAAAGRAICGHGGVQAPVRAITIALFFRTMSSNSRVGPGLTSTLSTTASASHSIRITCALPIAQLYNQTSALNFAPRYTFVFFQDLIDGFNFQLQVTCCWMCIVFMFIDHEHSRDAGYWHNY